MKRKRVVSYRNNQYQPPRKRITARRVVTTITRAPTAPAASRGWAGFGPWGASRSRELKVIDTAPTTVKMGSTGAVTLLNGVATGTDYNTRVGRKIRIRSIFIRGECTPVDATTGASTGRGILFYDSQSNGAGAPAITDVLDTSTSISQLNINNRDRFKILWDFEFNIYNSAVRPNVVYKKKYKRCNLETIYNGTGATAASIQTGGIYLLTTGSTTDAEGGNFGFTCRIRFSDE